MDVNSAQAQQMEVLSRLVIRAHCNNRGAKTKTAADPEPLRRDLRYVSGLSASQLADFLALANAHHVIVRGLTVLENAANVENETRVAEWCAGSLAAERARIERAVRTLQLICNALESRECHAAVIKSLDHWPDFGSDLDLYTMADGRLVEQTMQEEFHARPVARSWGDRLANKWNYRVPGLPELVEIHVQYLGQTGEHEEIGERVIRRRVSKTIGGYEFYVPAPEERIVISALQRVYRHFYFRLCDMVDTALLLQTEVVRFDELTKTANWAGIEAGVVTFLRLIQNYVARYGGMLPLPDDVMAWAPQRISSVQFKDGYLRVPKTTAAALHASQFLQAGLRRDGRALLRLPLLPSLGVCALVARGLTGNDKGIW
jgi:hypothetical protein